jgi:hypothetical protein
MEEAKRDIDTRQLIVETISALVEIVAEDVYRKKVLATGTPDEVKEDITEQLNEQVNSYKKELEKVIGQKVAMIDKIVQFREKLKMRHQKLPDNVLAKYDEFFELKDV